MDGDCGHGWAYHDDGPGGPCSKCVENEKEEKRLVLAAVRKARTSTLKAELRRRDKRKRK